MRIIGCSEVAEEEIIIGNTQLTDDADVGKGLSVTLNYASLLVVKRNHSAEDHLEEVV